MQKYQFRNWVKKHTQFLETLSNKANSFINQPFDFNFILFQNLHKKTENNLLSKFGWKYRWVEAFVDTIHEEINVIFAQLHVVAQTQGSSKMVVSR